MKIMTALLIGSIASAAHAQSTGISCSADFDLNGTVNGNDLSSLLGYWNTSESRYDLNGNGNVDGSDLTVVLAQWGQDCNPFNDDIEVSYGPMVATVISDGLPDPPVGPFDGSSGCFNPNTPTEQNDTWSIPITPVPTDNPAIDVLTTLGPIGVLVSGGAFYNAYDGGGQEAPGNICMDFCEGHPSPDGRYHYHQYSPCLGDVDAEDGHSGLIGFAFDGYPVYGLNDIGGTPPTDLDSCGGHTDPIRGYHYHFQKSRIGYIFQTSIPAAAFLPMQLYFLCQ